MFHWFWGFCTLYPSEWRKVHELSSTRPVCSWLSKTLPEPGVDLRRYLLGFLPFPLLEFRTTLTMHQWIGFGGSLSWKPSPFPRNPWVSLFGNTQKHGKSRVLYPNSGHLHLFYIYIYKYNIHIMSAHIWWFMMVPMDFPNLSTFHWATVGTLQAHFAPKPLPAAATSSLSAAVETVVVWTAGSNGDTQVVLNLVLNHPIRISHTKLYAVIMWNTNHPVEPYFFGGRSFQLLLTCCSLF